MKTLNLLPYEIKTLSELFMIKGDTGTSSIKDLRLIDSTVTELRKRMPPQPPIPNLEDPETAKTEEEKQAIITKNSDIAEAFKQDVKKYMDTPVSFIFTDTQVALLQQRFNQVTTFKSDDDTRKMMLSLDNKLSGKEEDKISE